jgi:hypothetical protein
VAVNIVVTRVSGKLAESVRAFRDWAADQIWHAKRGDKLRVGVMVDAGEDLPEWAG